MLPAGIIITVLAVLFTGFVWITNRGSLHNYTAPRADWFLIIAWLLVALVWIIYGLSAPAHAAAPATGDTTIPPGMVALALVRLPHDPDVRCVVPNCFTPPVIRDRPRRKPRSQREIEHRLLSPSGRGRLE